MPSSLAAGTPLAGAGRLPLRVASTSREAEGVLSFRLVDPSGGALPTWSPGAHLDLVLPSGLVRQYSLCGDVDDPGTYRIAVRLDASGRGGSRELHQTQLVGQVLQARGPRNHFRLVDAPAYALIAGGIGITPLLAMAQSLSRRGKPWRLVYGGRSLATMPFRSEIAGLEGGAVELVPEDTAGFPDVQSLLSALAHGTAVYACGPDPMLRAVEDLSRRLLPPGALHLERFAAPDPTGPPRCDVRADDGFQVELRRSGHLLEVPPERSVLSLVLEVVPDALYSCEEGFCGACETDVLEGEPDHRDQVLDPSERASARTMMICVSRARSPRLVLDL